MNVLKCFFLENLSVYFNEIWSPFFEVRVILHFNFGPGLLSALEEKWINKKKRRRNKTKT